MGTDLGQPIIGQSQSQEQEEEWLKTGLWLYPAVAVGMLAVVVLSWQVFIHILASAGAAEPMKSQLKGIGTIIALAAGVVLVVVTCLFTSTILTLRRLRRT